LFPTHQNALDLLEPRTVVQAFKFQYITPILKSLRWLKVSELIEYKIIFYTKRSISFSRDFFDLISSKPSHGYNTRSSPYVTLIKPSS